MPRRIFQSEGPFLPGATLEVVRVTGDRDHFVSPLNTHIAYFIAVPVHGRRQVSLDLVVVQRRVKLALPDDVRRERELTLVPVRVFCVKGVRKL